MNRYRCLTVLVAAAATLCAASAKALINPHFTPIHLVRQAELILSVDLKQGQSKDQYSATIREVLKGKTDVKTLRLDLSKAINKENAEALRDLASAAKPALFFVGEFAEEKGGQGGEAPPRRGYLHVGGQWAEFSGGQEGLWALTRIDAKSQGVWAGGTDMLRRAVDYIIQDDDPEVPVTDGAAWSSDPQKIVTLSGKIRAVRPIDLAGDGKLLLYIARDEGDRLLACDAKSRKFTDITAARRLEAKSQAFAWGDFAGNGRLDLISVNGKTVSLHSQQADGTFVAKPLDLNDALANGCIGLSALDCGTKGRAGFLVSTTSWPVLVTFDGGKPSPVALSAPGIGLKKLGKPGSCLVADLDNDGVADILLPFAAGSVLFRGVAPGKFAPGVACAVQLGAGQSAACLADFDGDGRFDVLCVSSDGVRLWQNEGEGKFADALNLSGEIAYISKPDGIDCQVGDINNDGRQDALIAYAAMSPQLFFNRGYRSFGHAHTLDIAEKQLLEASKDGQQSACLGDFDGDGAQDMVMALTNGEIWAFFRENDDHEARSVIAALPVAGEYKGPVAVTGWIGKRCLGAWNVVPGASQAFFGRRDAGSVTLKWRMPGGKEQQREVVVEKETARVEIK